jgi:hypothetical protein
MLQRSSLSSTVSSELNAPWPQSWLQGRWGRGLELIWLPVNARQYLLVLVAVTVLAAGMLSQVWFNVQITQEQRQLQGLEAQRQQIERQNSELVYAIAATTSLRQIEQYALAQGYRPTMAPVYASRQPPVELSDAQPTPAAVGRMQQPATARDGFWAAAGRGLDAGGTWILQQAQQGSAAAVHWFTEVRRRWMP